MDRCLEHFLRAIVLARINRINHKRLSLSFKTAVQAGKLAGRNGNICFRQRSTFLFFFSIQIIFRKPSNNSRFDTFHLSLKNLEFPPANLALFSTFVLSKNTSGRHRLDKYESITFGSFIEKKLEKKSATTQSGFHATVETANFFETRPR